MGKTAEHEAALAEINTEATSIGSAIDALIAQFVEGDLTQEQSAILEQIKTETAKLPALGKLAPTV